MGNLDNSKNKIGGVKDKVTKIRDDLKKSEEKFQLGNYLDKNENGKYCGSQPGVKDIIQNIQSDKEKSDNFMDNLLNLLLQISNWIEQIIDMVMSIVDLVTGIFDSINEGFQGGGLPLNTRNELLNEFQSSCLGNISYDPTDRSSIENFALSSIIIGLSCLNKGDSFSKLNQLFSDTVTRDYCDEKARLQWELDNVLEYDPNRETRVKQLEEKIEEVDVKVNELRDGVNRKFAQTVPIIILYTANLPKDDLKGIVDVLTDISNTEAGKIAGNEYNGLGRIALDGLSNGLEFNKLNIKNDKNIITNDRNKQYIYLYLDEIKIKKLEYVKDPLEDERMFTYIYLQFTDDLYLQLIKALLVLDKLLFRCGWSSCSQSVYVSIDYGSVVITTINPVVKALAKQHALTQEVVLTDKVEDMPLYLVHQL
jgi:hypothetical protein